MASDCADLVSAILLQCFGEIVQKVGNSLFRASARSLKDIMNGTGLSRADAVFGLSVLIKYRLAYFECYASYPNIPHYLMRTDEVLYILRYPRYIHFARTKYGAVGVAIIEEMIHAGSESISQLIVKCLRNNESKEKVEKFRDTVLEMIKQNYLVRIPSRTPTTNNVGTAGAEETKEDVIPNLQLDDCDFYRPPEIDITFLTKVYVGIAKIKEAKDLWQKWVINKDRFHIDYRDAIMIDALERKLGPTAAQCFDFFLKQMYERTNAWQSTSNPISFGEIKQKVEKQSDNLDLIKYLDQYVTLIAEDSLGFLCKTGEAGGGQYVVDMTRAFEELAYTCIEKIISERFGSKASRIFRVIRMRKFIEQEDLQKEVMIPAKESKSLSYNLISEQFVHIKTIRKAGGGGSGPTKTYYLFHIKQHKVINMLIEMCYKALANNITRANHEKSEHQRLIVKAEKLDSIVATMKDRGESEDYIAEITETVTPPEREILNKVKNRIKSLSKAELVLDETILLLTMFQLHCPYVKK